MPVHTYRITEKIPPPPPQKKTKNKNKTQIFKCLELKKLQVTTMSDILIKENRTHNIKILI